MEPVFNKLDREEFKRRIAESFPAVYLTIISIIQGVALGILATKTHEYIKNSCLAEPWLRFLPYSVMSFLLIIVVSHEYTWFLGIFKWPPRVLDTVIPFAIGFSEISPMFFLTNSRIWWFLTAAFCSFGALAFSYTLWNCRRAWFRENTNKEAYDKLISTLRQDISMALILAPICICGGVFYSSSTKVLYWNWPEILFFISLFTIAIYILLMEQRFMKELHHNFSLIY